jgi:hypothetical protein
VPAAAPAAVPAAVPAAFVDREVVCARAVCVVVRAFGPRYACDLGEAGEVFTVLFVTEAGGEIVPPIAAAPGEGAEGAVSVGIAGVRVVQHGFCVARGHDIVAAVVVARSGAGAAGVVDVARMPAIAGLDQDGAVDAAQELFRCISARRVRIFESAVDLDGGAAERVVEAHLGRGADTVGAARCTAAAPAERTLVGRVADLAALGGAAVLVKERAPGRACVDTHGVVAAAAEAPAAEAEAPAAEVRGISGRGIRGDAAGRARALLRKLSVARAAALAAAACLAFLPGAFNVISF